MQQQLQLARRCLDDAKQRQRAYMQKGMEDTAFQQGEYVWLSTINLRRRFTGTPKLMPRYVGPFKVVKLVGETSYKLDLGETGKRLHDVFHSSLLRRHKGPIPKKVSPIVFDGDEDKRGERYEVERILKHRCRYRTRPKADGTRTEKVLDDVQYLIRWKGFDDLHDTWEPSANVDGADTALLEYWQKWVSQNPSETPPVSLLSLPGVA
jgi:Chromo (CHRromatin Organisation MOdifier) domain